MPFVSNYTLNMPGNFQLQPLRRFTDIAVFCSGVFFIAAPCTFCSDRRTSAHHRFKYFTEQL